MAQVTPTFDNGPTLDTTPMVLDKLAERQMQAYFCLVGKQLMKSQQNIDIAQETQRVGHVLVNHSMTHGVALGDDPTAAHAQREISEMDDLIGTALGEERVKWFRPFGRGGEVGYHLFSGHALNEIHDLRYSALLWNCVPRDWEDPVGWVETALSAIGEQAHTVVVLHDVATGA